MVAPALPETVTIDASPYSFTFAPRKTALLLIDMQRDFLLEGGFGEIQGGNLQYVQASIAPTKQLLDLCRRADLTIFHTREGHQPDLADLPSSKIRRQAASGNGQHGLVIGDKGAMGRLLVRGEYGHDFVDELAPLPGEVVIDKPGKGAFFNTTLFHKLKVHGITHLLVGGVTTECCVNTTVREANDRGFECCVISDATAAYHADLKRQNLDVIVWSQGLFGFVAALEPLVNTLQAHLKVPVNDLPPLDTWDRDLRVPSLKAAYKSGLSPVVVVEALYKRIEAYQKVDSAVWILLRPLQDIVDDAKALLARPHATNLPLFGVPFNDVIHNGTPYPTTVACPPLAYTPKEASPLFGKLIEAGGLWFGKVNMDQFATGLSGCRSPYGITHSYFHEDYISGGSSSGSGVSVGASLVSISLGTDTAGSGRVPAALNGCVGFKPTRGLMSMFGLLPACRSIDGLGFLCKSVEDARTVLQVLEGSDPRDIYAKPVLTIERHINAIGPEAKSFKFGIPDDEALAICAPAYRRMFDQAIKQLQAIGGTLVPIDYTSFRQAEQLLYAGSMVSERFASMPGGFDFIDKNREHLHPTIVELFSQVHARNSSAYDAYLDLQTQMKCKRQIEEHVFKPGPQGIDFLCMPTVPTHFTIAEMLADPIKNNSILGEFTHSCNILDLCGISIPAGQYPVAEMSGSSESKGVLPFALMIYAPCRMDAELLDVSIRFEESLSKA